MVKLADKTKARALYTQGYSYNQILKKLPVSKSSLSLWCRDLAAARRKSQPAPKTKLPKTPKAAAVVVRGEGPWAHCSIRYHHVRGVPTYVNLVDLETNEAHYMAVARYVMAVHIGRILTSEERVVRIEGKSNAIENLKLLQKTEQLGSALSDADVIRLREMARTQTHHDIPSLILEFNAKPSTLRQAIKGVTFKHLDAIAPPVTKQLRKPRVAVTLEQARDALLLEALALRRQDPLTWTYPVLAQWLSERTGKRYRGPHVVQALTHRDPTIRELDPPPPPKPVKVPKEKTVKAPRVRKPPKEPVLLEHECVMCEAIFHTKWSTKDTCSDACAMLLRSYQASSSGK